MTSWCGGTPGPGLVLPRSVPEPSAGDAWIHPCALCFLGRIGLGSDEDLRSREQQGQQAVSSRSAPLELSSGFAVPSAPTRALSHAEWAALAAVVGSSVCTKGCLVQRG